MACGVPVVGTRVVGSEEAVEDGVTGLLVPFGDAKALARAVLRLFSEPELRERLRNAAHENVLREHSRTGAAARTESFYRELTAPERGLVHV
jgi:glycosyltransferase involved in cell wall biosynthesis